MRPWRALLLALLLAAIIPAAQSALWQGSIDTTSTSTFLAKFCYAVGTGSFQIVATSSTPNATAIEVFSSTEHYSRAQTETCANRWNVANIDFPYGVANITVPVQTSGTPTWWYVFATDCVGKASELQYSITFLNPGNPVWTAPFSANDQGLLLMYLIFVGLYILAFPLQVWGICRLYNARALHPIAVILAAVMVMETVALFLTLEHYAAFSSDGVGHPVVKLFGELLDMTAVTLLMFLFLLIAKGWGVSDNPLTHQRFLVVFITVVAGAYAGLFIWQQDDLSPASTTFYYDAWPGWVVVGLRVVVLCYMAYCVRISWLEENHPNKRRFYAVFGALAGLWLIVLPAMVGFAYLIPNYARTRVLMATLTSVNAAAIAALAFLLWPSRAAYYFKIAPPELYPEDGSSAGGAPRLIASNNLYEEL